MRNLTFISTGHTCYSDIQSYIISNFTDNMYFAKYCNLYPLDESIFRSCLTAQPAYGAAAHQGGIPMQPMYQAPRMPPPGAAPMGYYPPPSGPPPPGYYPPLGPPPPGQFRDLDTLRKETFC